MGEGKPETVTRLYADMSICSEFLHCSHKEFLDLPKLEQKKLRLYVVVQNEKFDFEEKKMKAKADREEVKQKAKQQSGLQKGIKGR